ncbi:coiled-coil domain-containing protein 63-like [Pieris napi]|uniref:coiled-coil domain-containing protein 63-like n=1 Tax=Pieris napi TaxID=78633 RepID=UPI001FBA33F2|nr:coiled-coil domain-containing protein 63-like [Pieris napi]
MTAPGEDMEMEKMAEDELAKLRRQFRVMEVDRGAVGRSARPALRRQRGQLRALSADLDRVCDRLRRSRGAAALPRDARSEDRLRLLLAERDEGAARVRESRANVAELDFLSKQVQKEIERLRSKGTASDGESGALGDRTIVARLENRLDTAMTKFDTVNGENYHMRLRIDRLLRDRRFFNGLRKTRMRRLTEGKAEILELVEQAIGTYDQREEWGARLDALEERAAVDRRRHRLEVRELRRRLDHGAKLEEFLRTKGTVRLTAADAKAEAKRLERREMETRTRDNYVDILDALEEYAGETDVDRLMQEFTRREEENYALFNYINEVNSELKNLSDNVETLEAGVAEEHAKRRAELSKRRDSAGALRATLQEKRGERERLRVACDKTRRASAELLGRVRKLAGAARCDALPLLKLLGRSSDVNESNARLYIESLERRAAEFAEALRPEERPAESKERSPRRRRRPEPSPRR